MLGDQLGELFVNIESRRVQMERTRVTLRSRKAFTGLWGQSSRVLFPHALVLRLLGHFAVMFVVSTKEARKGTPQSLFSYIAVGPTMIEPFVPLGPRPLEWQHLNA